MIYKFKMITGRKDNFFRIYDLEEDCTLYDFHRLIQDDLDYDAAQMVAFYASNANCDKNKQYALFDMGDGAMDTITLKNLIDDNIKILLYTYDFYNNRSFIIEFTGEMEPECRVSYPRTADSKGTPPDQFVDIPLPEPLPIDNQLLPNENEEEGDNEDDEEEDDDNNNDFDNDELSSLTETNEV